MPESALIGEAMWAQIERLPISRLRSTTDFKYIEKVLSLARRYRFDGGDRHLCDPKYTLPLGQLLCLVADRCLTRLAQLQASAPPAPSQSGTTRAQPASALDAAQECADLKARLAQREQELERMRNDDTRFQLEYRHLAARHKRLQEQLAQTSAQLAACREHAVQTSANAGDGKEAAVAQLQLEALRHENAALLAARDRADERREQLERDALRDMTELRQLTQRAVDEERAKTEAARNEAAGLRHERDVLQAHLAASQVVKQPDSVSANKHAYASNEVTCRRGGDKGHDEIADDDSDARIEELRMRLEACEATNVKLVRLVKQYEAGDDGLRRLRHELAEACQRSELAADENGQLRERLAAAQRSEAFYRALQSLCERLGVSEEEVRRLRAQALGTEGAPIAFSELDALTEEARLLREEVEWLEKDRRYWMHKVRMQPLLDTKLRLELGLTSEQLARLDALVERWRSTGAASEDVLAENVMQPSPRHRGVQSGVERVRGAALSRFSGEVRQRLDALVRDMRAKMGSESEVVSNAVEALEGQLDELVAQLTSGDEVTQDASKTVNTLVQQVASLTRRAAEAELALKEERESSAKAREQAAALTEAHDAVSRERDRYREAIFEAAGLPPIKHTPHASTADDGSSSVPALVQVPNSEMCAQGNSGIRPSLLQEGVALQQQAMNGGRWTALASVLRAELAAKDGLVRAATSQSHALRDELARQHQTLTEAQERLSQSQHAQEELQDKIAVLGKLNEELTAQLHVLEKMNQDVQEAVSLAKESRLQEVTQKVVLLRRREGVLLQRLRRALEAEHAATTTTQALRASMARSLDSLRETLEGGSTGLLLPPSAVQHGAERALLNYVSQAVEQLRKGRLFREDSRLLLQLRGVLSTTEELQELRALRRKAAAHRGEVQALQKQVDAQKVELAELRALRSSAASAPTSLTVSTPSATQAECVKLESQLASWRQRHTLCARRLEEKEEEVALLEVQLEDCRQELLEVREHATQLLEKERFTSLAVAVTPGPASHDELGGDGQQTHIAQMSRWEQEVARMRSINLALVLHSTDQQGIIRGLEADLDGQKQELALLRESGETDLAHRFISAAVREHAALRKQSELALLEAKRLRVQLAATEANYQVACNEATTYKLSAYRLYRRYVDEMVSTVDYVRSLQRSHQGGLSARRVMAINERLRAVEAELENALSECTALSVQLQDCRNALAMREGEMAYMRAESTSDKDDAIAAMQRDLAAKLRECTRQLTESREDCKHVEAKNARLEQHIHTLNEELTRLEYGPYGDAAGHPLSDHLLRELQELKETVYARSEAAAVVPSASATVQPESGTNNQANRAGVAATGAETDVAIREYKAAVMKQAELRHENEKLRRELDMVRADLRQATGTVATLTDEVALLQERLHGAQGQLEEERNKAAVREAWLQRAHASQGEVAQRAAEHNAACLQDMLAKKEQAIQQLQRRLDVERRRVVEQQVAESSRVERLHEQLFRDNNAMVERFREAIQGVEVAIAMPTADGTTSNALTGPAGEQLRVLTGEVMRLQQELRAARSTNIMLESRVQEQQSVRTAEGLPCASPDGLAAQVAVKNNAGADVLTTMLHDQGALLESLRRREQSLADDLRRERERRTAVEEQLRDALQRSVGDEGQRQLWTSVAQATESEPALVRELRTQVTVLEDELRRTQQALADERADTQRGHAAAENRGAQVDTLQQTIVTQEDDLARAQQLAVLNEKLQHDLHDVKEQNDKLLLAATLLKEKLIEEAHRGGDSARKCQQEIALVRRMAAMQGESAESIQALDLRVAAVQREVEQRMKTEKTLRAKNEEAEKLLQQLHAQLRMKEEETAQLRGRLQQAASTDHIGSTTLQAAPSPHQATTRRAEKGTQMYATDPLAAASVASTGTPAAVGLPQRVSSVQRDNDRRAAEAAPPVVTLVDPEVALMEPQLVAILQRAVQKHQRDNLEQISVLRSKLHRCENDLDDAQAHLKAERKSVRSLRTQLLATQRMQEKLAADHAREVARLMQARVQESTVAPFNDATARNQNEAKARRQIDKPEQTVRAQQERPRTLQGNATTQFTKLPVLPLPQAKVQPAASETIPMRQHVQVVMKLESTIDELRRQLQVEVAAREAVLRLRITHLTRTLDTMLQDLAVTQRSSIEELRRHYELTEDSAAEATVPKSVQDLEMELLRKSNALLDMQFGRELQEIKLERLQRHLDSVLTSQHDSTIEPTEEVDRANSARCRAQQNELEQLHALVENLQLVIRKLQAEKAELIARHGRRTESAPETQQTSEQRDICALRAERRQLQNQLARRVTHGAPASRHRGEREADLERQLHTAQATARQYLLELHELRARAAQTGPVSGAPRVLEGSVESDRRAVRPLPPTSKSASCSSSVLSSSSSVVRGVGGTRNLSTPPPLPPSPVNTISHTDVHHQRDLAMAGLDEPATHSHQRSGAVGKHRALLHSDMAHHQRHRP